MPDDTNFEQCKNELRAFLRSIFTYSYRCYDEICNENPQKMHLVVCLSLAESNYNSAKILYALMPSLERSDIDDFLISYERFSHELLDSILTDHSYQYSMQYLTELKESYSHLHDILEIE